MLTSCTVYAQGNANDGGRVESIIMEVAESVTSNLNALSIVVSICAQGLISFLQARVAGFVNTESHATSLRTLAYSPDPKVRTTLHDHFSANPGCSQEK